MSWMGKSSELFNWRGTMAFYGNTWSSESMIAGHIGGHNMFGPCTGQWE